MGTACFNRAAHPDGNDPPPFGINLFVIHGIRGRGAWSDVEPLGTLRHRPAAMIDVSICVARHRHGAAAVVRLRSAAAAIQ